MANLINKIPPQNIEAEKSLLGSILIDGNSIYKIMDTISPSDFYQTSHQVIYKHIVSLIEKREPVDVVTLSASLEKSKELELAGGAKYIAKLTTTVNSSAHIASYSSIIRDSSILRNLISAGSKIVELAFQEEKEITEVIDEAEKALYGVSQSYLSQSFIPIQDILSASFERIDELHRDKGKLRGVESGFRDIDNLVAGFQPSDLIIIAARPSMGKSSLALNMTLNAALKEKKPVAVFSLEMSKDQVVDRLLVNLAGVDSWKLRTGNLSDEDFPRIGEAMGQLSEAPIYIDDSPLLNVIEMRAKLRRLQSEHGLCLIVIDYLQLMEGVRSYGDNNRVQEISQISRSLKGIARELDVPVIALSQLSRAVEQRHPKIPQLADLRESGCLSGDTLIVDSSSGKLTRLDEIVDKNLSLELITSEKNFQLKSTSEIKSFYTGINQTYKIKLQTGKTIKATANHKFLTLDGWKRLDKLKVDDFIATPRQINYISSNRISKHRIVLMAHLIGDGCTLKRQPIHYTNADLSCHSVVSTSAQKLFAIQPRLVAQGNYYHTYLPSPYHLTHGINNPIANWFSKINIFNLRSREKFIPEIIFSQPYDNIALFLKHLWATDGCISKYKNSYRIYYASGSRKLSSQVCHLLLRFGIIARLKKSSKLGYKDIYNVDISGAKDQLKFCQEIGIFGNKSKLVKRAIVDLKQLKSNPNCDIVPKEIWQKIKELVKNKGWSQREFHKQMGWSYSGTQRFGNGISRSRLHKIAQVLKSNYLTELAKSDIYWDKIESIGKSKIEKVYDLTIAKTHNFIANDIIVHNSIEQDADLVMFIYREDYYEPDSERKNIADILVKKHRHGPIGQVELYFLSEQMKFANFDKRKQ